MLKETEYAKQDELFKLACRPGEKKDSSLFIYLLWELVCRFSSARLIHVVLDNYSIHKTRQVEFSLASEQGLRLRLHFLPPYCTDHNRIERKWRDLHANVTRNHTCVDMKHLMREVRHFLKQHNKNTLTPTVA